MNPDANRSAYLFLAFAAAVGCALAIFLLANAQGVGLALALAGFTALVAAALASPEAAFYSLVLVATTEALYKGAASNMFTMLVKDVFLWVMVAQLLWTSQQRRDFSWLHQRLTPPAVIFSAYCVAMMFAPFTRSVLLALAGLRVWTLWMPLYYPVYSLFGSRRRIYRFLGALLLLQLPICLYGIVQGNIGYEHTKGLEGFYRQTRFYGAPAAEGEGSSRGSGPVSDSDLGSGEGVERRFRPLMAVRACSLYTSPGYFGAMAVLTATLGLGVMGWARSRRLRLVATVTALAGVGGLLASGSRAPMVGLLAALLAMTFASRRRGMVILSVALIVLGAFYLLRDITGAGARRIERQLTAVGALERSLQPLRQGWSRAVANPFVPGGIATGIGAGRMLSSGALDLQHAEGSRFIENEFGRALAELGFVGAGLWLWMVLVPLLQVVGAIRKLGREPAGMLVVGMLGLMVSIFVQLGVGSALYGGAGMYYYIFAALSRRLAELPPDAAETAAGELGAERPPLRRYGFVHVRG